jgi:hypothetical protein
VFWINIIKGRDVKIPLHNILLEFEKFIIIIIIIILQRVIERKIQGGIEVTEGHGRRRRKLLDNLKERRGYSHLKEEALDRTMWRARFGRGFRPVVRQTTK